MTVESHIHSLKSRHAELETQIKELNANAVTNERQISSLKRRKLQIKDRIAELSASASQ